MPAYDRPSPVPRPPPDNERLRLLIEFLHHPCYTTDAGDDDYKSAYDLAILACLRAVRRAADTFTPPKSW